VKKMDRANLMDIYYRGAESKRWGRSSPVTNDTTTSGSPCDQHFLMTRGNDPPNTSPESSACQAQKCPLSLSARVIFRWTSVATYPSIIANLPANFLMTCSNPGTSNEPNGPATVSKNYTLHNYY
jgi:hypothetical protein